MKSKNNDQRFFLKSVCVLLFVFTVVFEKSYGQTLTGASSAGLENTGTLTYNLKWYSSERVDEYNKVVLVDYQNFSSTDKITVTGNSSSGQVQYWQVKESVSNTWKDITLTSGGTTNLCFAPGTGSGTVTLTFRRMGNGGVGTFLNDISVEVADNSCNISTGTGKKITFNASVTVDQYVYNFSSQATLANWGDNSAWEPSRSTLRTNDVLVFDRGSTPVTVNVNVSSQTIKNLILTRDADVLLDDRFNTRTLTFDGSGAGVITDATSILRIKGTDTTKFNLTNGAEADINGDLIIQTPTASTDVCRLSFTGGGNIYFGGDVDVQTRTSLRVEPSSQNTIFFDGESQEFKGSGSVYFNYLTNVTTGVSGKSSGPNSKLTLKRGLPILGVLTLRDYSTIENTTQPASASAADWQAWLPDLQIKNDGKYRGRIATLGASASITGASYFEMYSNGIRTFRTIAFPMDNMHLSQITDDLIVSGTYSGNNKDSMDNTCGYCKASSYFWNEATSAWDSINGNDNPTKITSGKGLLLFFRGLASNGLGDPSAAANAGNIDYKGLFTTGTKTVTLAKSGSGTFSGYNLVGNPYPCHIDFTKLTRTNVQNKFQILDPTTKSYNVWNNTSGSLAKTGSSKFTGDANANIIEIGASFFAIADQNNGTIEFNEDDKVTTEPAATAFRTEPTPVPCNQLQSSIRFVADTIDFMDMSILEWNTSLQDVSLNLDKYDADKFFGGYVAIGSMTPENHWLTMDYRPNTGETTQIVPLSVRTMQNTAYKLSFKTCANNTEYDLSIRDKQTDALIKLEEETDYVFNTSNSDKFGNDRFEVVIETKTNQVASASSDFKVLAYPNPTQSHNFHLLGLQNKQNVNVHIVDISGKTVKSTFDQGTVYVADSVKAGTYFVKVVSSTGTAFTKINIQ
jgi:hypothetical protein